MAETLVASGVIALIFGLLTILLFYLGRVIKHEQKIGYIAWFKTSRVRNIAGFTRWVGGGLIVEGYLTLLALAGLFAASLFGASDYLGPVLFGWITLFVIWFIVLATGTRRYC